MPRLNAGDVATVLFAGADKLKRRPVVVLSSDLYQNSRPDVVVGLLTSNLAAAITSLDYVLLDWMDAGLRKPSAFRAYFQTDVQQDLQKIGQLSSRDWQAVQTRVAMAFALHIAPVS